VNQDESASAEGDNDRSADWCRSASDAQLAVRQSQTTVRVRFKGSGVLKRRLVSRVDYSDNSN
jgi:hypothetical protein